MGNVTVIGAQWGDEAVALVSVDDAITPKLAKKLCGLPGVRDAVPLSF